MHLRHAQEGTYNWSTGLGADQAGYYVYLPVLFVYDFEAHALPPSIADRIGSGASGHQAGLFFHAMSRMLDL